MYHIDQWIQGHFQDIDHINLLRCDQCEEADMPQLTPDMEQICKDLKRTLLYVVTKAQ